MPTGMNPRIEKDNSVEADVLDHREGEFRVHEPHALAADQFVGYRILGADGIGVKTPDVSDTAKIKFLKDKIDKINSLSKDELKDMYKFILNHQKLSAKGGGGLGLVDIARKTGNKLEYTFQHYQDDYYFFNLDVFITEDN